MSRESLRGEPVLDEEIVQQNEELMDEKFPEILLEEWDQSVVPMIKDILANNATMSDDDLRAKSHKCAGSALQIGGHQLGTSLRTVSHMIQSGNRELANGILEDIPEYFDAFVNEIKNSKE